MAFTDLLSSEQQRFKIHAIAQAAKSAPQPAVPKVATKAFTEVLEATNKRPWVPKKQYLAKLAAEKKAADAAAVAAAAASADDAPARAPSRRNSRRRSRPRSQRRTDTRRPLRETPCTTEAYPASPPIASFPIEVVSKASAPIPPT